MAWDRDGVRIPKTIFETAAAHESVKVWCSRCPNAVVFEAAGLWWHFHTRHWDDHFDLARQRFWCAGCAIGGLARVRPGMLEAVRELPSRALLPLPEDREWKRQIRRYRS
jgi:hypothetical protein